MRRLLSCIVLAALLLAGCTGPLDTKLDASSQDAYTRSINAIKAKLAPEETKKFEEALRVVAFSTIPTEGGLIGMIAAMKDPEKAIANMLSTVNGKTPREIIALANAKVAERAKEELKSVIAEIATLEKNKAEAGKAQAVLALITVTSPRYYWGGSEYYRTPRIELTVTNNTGMALSRLYFHGIVSTPGRTIPWIEESFNYTVPGGIEHGETTRLLLAPNRYSKWGAGETQGRTDLVFTVTAVNADNAEKKPIAAEFDKDDAERLTKLHTLKAELDQKIKTAL